MRRPYDSVIIDLICRVMTPFLLLFGLYVIAHGHYSPGGGFQGGAMLAAGVMLMRICLGARYSASFFPPRLALVLGVLGTLVFAGLGVVAMLGAGAYLDYGHIPIPGIPAPDLRYLSVLLVEIGIGVAVVGLLILIYDSLTTSEEPAEE